MKVVGPDENEEDSPTMTMDEYYASQGKTN